MEKFIIRQSTPKVILNLVFSLISCAVLTMLAVIAYNTNWTVFVLGVIGGIYFFIQIIFNIRRLINPLDILVCDANGIYDNSHSAAVGQIYWNEIKAIEKVKFMGTKFIGINVNNMENFLSRMDEVAKNNIFSNIKCKCLPIEIIMESAKGSVDENLEKIALVWDYYKTHPEKVTLAEEDETKKSSLKEEQKAQKQNAENSQKTKKEPE